MVLVLVGSMGQGAKALPPLQGVGRGRLPIGVGVCVGVCTVDLERRRHEGSYPSSQRARPSKEPAAKSTSGPGDLTETNIWGTYPLVKTIVKKFHLDRRDPNNICQRSFLDPVRKQY